jgi:choline dehydrogenase-like flavoprotein
MTDFDVCVIGSGAGGGPIALELAVTGRSVVVLEKGPWFKEADFYKDELACCHRRVYRPELKDEPQVIDERDAEGRWTALPTTHPASGWDFWNGNCVGGSSNFMSGYFHRQKPDDFHLLAAYGPIAGAAIADWPIGYDALETYYTKAEREVGISGKVTPHRFLEPRSTPDFAYPPTAEHALCGHIDRACAALGLTPLTVARAILSKPDRGRGACSYSGYCGSYGCQTAAKGSSRAALLDRAVATGRCEIRPHSKVSRLESDASGRVIAVHYHDREGRPQRLDAKAYVVACQAIETSRLLLYSTGPKHPDGLGNHSGQLGRNLIFSAGATGSGRLLYRDADPAEHEALRAIGPFVNRGLQEWYVIDDPAMGGRLKGGTIDFVLNQPNAIARALAQRADEDGGLIWGRRFKRNLERAFSESVILRFEVFNDWLPNADCFVSLDPEVKDKWGDPVARVRIGHHDHDLRVAGYLAGKAALVMEKMGLKDVTTRLNGAPTPNLQAGGCRFGADPATSVLDPDCRVHGTGNVYVSDGSFMPTGGSAPFTWTIYANSFRVADRIRAAL